MASADTATLSSSAGTPIQATSGNFAGGVRRQSVSISAVLAPHATVIATGGSTACTGTCNGFIFALSGR